jgi:elongation factor Ts
MTITADQIKQLRTETGAGFLDCKKALEQFEGDFEKSVEFLREKGLAKAAKRADRVASEGVIDLYSHGDGRVGVAVEVNCETDFVARSESFREFAHEIALQVAAGAPEWIQVEDIPEEVIENERKDARNFAVAEGKPENVIDRIVEGRLEKFYDDKCLMRQEYIRDDSITIQDLLNQLIAKIGENIVIRRFMRWELGEASQ